MILETQTAWNLPSTTLSTATYIAQLPYQAATRPGVQVKRLAAIHELLHALRKYLLSHMTL